MNRTFLMMTLILLLCAAAQLQAADGTGILAGRITIGPLRPGPTRADEPEPLPPKEFIATHRLVILDQAKQKVKEATLDDKGFYKIELAPGDYFVALEPNDVGMKKRPPAPVTIQAGKTATLNLDFDTGMR